MKTCLWYCGEYFEIDSYSIICRFSYATNCFTTLMKFDTYLKEESATPDLVIININNFSYKTAKYYNNLFKNSRSKLILYYINSYPTYFVPKPVHERDLIKTVLKEVLDWDNTSIYYLQTKPPELIFRDEQYNIKITINPIKKRLTINWALKLINKTIRPEDIRITSSVYGLYGGENFFNGYLDILKHYKIK